MQYKGGIQIDLLTIYWYVLIGSLILAILFLFIGDFLDGILDGLFHPLLIFGSLAVISGSGILLTKYTNLSAIIILCIGLGIGVVAYVLIHNFLIVPLSSAEASNTFSEKDYEGRIAEVITTIPAQGYGEVIIPSKMGSRSETARSFDNQDINHGLKVVVVQVDQEGVLHVSPIEDELDEKEI